MIGTFAPLTWCVLVALIAVLVSGCSSGSGEGNSSPTAPTAPTPAGSASCTGAAVPQVEIGFQSRDGLGMIIQLFGETISQPTLPLNQTFTVTRAVTPCSYEITGQMLGGQLTVSFGRTSPFSNPSQGVERGSVVIDEGPGTFGPENYCHVIFRALSPDGGPTPPGPYNIKLRFRVSTTNAIGTTGGGCG